MLVRQLAGRSPLSAKDFSLRWPSHLSGKFATVVVSVHSFTLFLFDLLTMELAKSSTFKFSQVPSTLFLHATTASPLSLSAARREQSHGALSLTSIRRWSRLMDYPSASVGIITSSFLLLRRTPPHPSFPLRRTRVITSWLWCFLHRLSTTLPAVLLSGNGRSDSNLVFVQITAHTCV